MKAAEPQDHADILEELGLANYISNDATRAGVETPCKDVLASLVEGGDQQDQIHCALVFIEALWKKYDCEEIADIYEKFVQVEEGLYGLVRHEEANQRYRDHFVHMFNVFVLGLRIISPLLANSDTERAQEMFKVKDEKLKDYGIPFEREYNYKERLFYLWTLISTFHDIGIPFQHFSQMWDGINRYTEQFGQLLRQPSFDSSPFDSGQLYSYLCMLSTIYGEGIALENNVDYRKADKPNDFLVKTLGREYDDKNHGVLSGFFMWKTIEGIFLTGKSDKYPLNIEQFNEYSEHVLEQDIARAALAISLHNLKPTRRQPSIHPLRFDSFPLTFILILVDGLQEYTRPEGTSVKREVVFTAQPHMSVALGEFKPSVEVTFTVDERRADELIEKASRILRAKNIDPDVEDLEAAVVIIGKEIVEPLEKSLDFDETFDFQFEIWIDGKNQPSFGRKQNLERAE